MPNNPVVVPMHEEVIVAYEELFKRLMTCKHCKETVVGPPDDGLPLLDQDSMFCSFCGKSTPLKESRPYENVREFIEFLHKEDEK